ncbi:MAG: hypothetical protein GJ680_18845 [Alteromonadaceae bacterium]|nr:hypothetical protein [Alteromonadaceae bacterium]
MLSRDTNVIRCLFILILVVLTQGCSKELPTLTATSKNQLTQELVLQATLSKDNQHAYLMTQGPVFTRWNIASGEPLQAMGTNELSRDTRSFAISDSEQRLVTSDGKSLSLWQLDDFSLLGSLDFRQQLGDAAITSMTFVSDNVLVTGNSDGSLIFADLNNQVFRQSHFHDNEVIKLLVSKNRDFLFSAGNDGKVVVTDLKVYATQNEYTTPFRITSMISNEDNSLFFISDALNQQAFWRPWQNRILVELDYWQQYRFFRLGMFINSDKYLITTSPKTEVSLWSTETGSEVATWMATSQSMGSTVMDIQVLDSNQIITLTSDAVIETWDLSSLF